MILISNDIWHVRKNYNFEPYNVLLDIATNIPVLLMTAFVLQANIHTHVTSLSYVQNCNLSPKKTLLEHFTKIKIEYI